MKKFDAEKQIIASAILPFAKTRSENKILNSVVNDQPELLLISSFYKNEVFKLKFLAPLKFQYLYSNSLLGFFLLLSFCLCFLRNF